MAYTTAATTTPATLEDTGVTLGAFLSSRDGSVPWVAEFVRDDGTFHSRIVLMAPSDHDAGLQAMEYLPSGAVDCSIELLMA